MKKLYREPKAPARQRLLLRPLCIALLICLCISSAACTGCKSCRGGENPTPDANAAVDDNMPKTSGSIYENASDFADGYTPEDINLANDNVRAYLQNICYVINSIDKESMTAEVTLSVPKVDEILWKVISDALQENPDWEREKLLELTAENFSAALEDADAPKSEYKLKLGLSEIDGKIKLVAGEELNNIIKGTLEEAYRTAFKMILEDNSDAAN